MVRVTASARGDLDKPIVSVDRTAPPWRRALAWLLRSYLVFAAAATGLAAIGLVILLLSL